MNFTGRGQELKLYSRCALNSVKISFIEGGKCTSVISGSHLVELRGDFHSHLLLCGFLFFNNEHVLLL